MEDESDSTKIIELKRTMLAEQTAPYISWGQSMNKNFVKLLFCTLLSMSCGIQAAADACAAADHATLVDTATFEKALQAVKDNTIHNAFRDLKTAKTSVQNFREIQGWVYAFMEKGQPAAYQATFDKLTAASSKLFSAYKTTGAHSFAEPSHGRSERAFMVNPLRMDARRLLFVIISKDSQIIDSLYTTPEGVDKEKLPSIAYDALFMFERALFQARQAADYLRKAKLLDIARSLGNIWLHLYGQNTPLKLTEKKQKNLYSRLTGLPADSFKGDIKALQENIINKLEAHIQIGSGRRPQRRARRTSSASAGKRFGTGSGGGGGSGSSSRAAAGAMPASGSARTTPTYTAGAGAGAGAGSGGGSGSAAGGGARVAASVEDAPLSTEIALAINTVTSTSDRHLGNDDYFKRYLDAHATVIQWLQNYSKNPNLGHFRALIRNLCLNLEDLTNVQTLTSTNFTMHDARKLVRHCSDITLFTLAYFEEDLPDLKEAIRRVLCKTILRNNYLGMIIFDLLRCTMSNNNEHGTAKAAVVALLNTLYALDTSEAKIVLYRFLSNCSSWPQGSEPRRSTAIEALYGAYIRLLGKAKETGDFKVILSCIGKLLCFIAEQTLDRPEVLVPLLVSNNKFANVTEVVALDNETPSDNIPQGPQHPLHVIDCLNGPLVKQRARAVNSCNVVAEVNRFYAEKENVSLKHLLFLVTTSCINTTTPALPDAILKQIQESIITHFLQRSDEGRLPLSQSLAHIELLFLESVLSKHPQWREVIKTFYNSSPTIQNLRRCQVRHKGVERALANIDTLLGIAVNRGTPATGPTPTPSTPSAAGAGAGAGAGSGGGSGAHHQAASRTDAPAGRRDPAQSGRPKKRRRTDGDDGSGNDDGGGSLEENNRMNALLTVATNSKKG